MKHLDSELGPELREVIACRKLLRRQVARLRGQAGHSEQPIAHYDDPHAEEISYQQVLKGFLSQLVTFSLEPTVVRCQKVGILGDLVGLEPVRKSTVFDLVVLAIDYLRRVIVEDYDTIENIAFNLASSHAHFRLNFPVQAHFSILYYLHISSRR